MTQTHVSIFEKLSGFNGPRELDAMLVASGYTDNNIVEIVQLDYEHGVFAVHFLHPEGQETHRGTCYVSGTDGSVDF